MTPLAHISGESHVAAKYGLEEAIFLHSLMFWYRTNRGNDQNFHDDRWWTYNSIKAFEAIFPWWNGGQVRRIIARCKDKGALLVGNYNKDQRDRTAWYTPSDELLELYGEIENCICRKQQMEDPESTPSFDENGEPLPCSNHGGTDIPPYSPPEGDAPPKVTEPEDKPQTDPKPNTQPKPKRGRRDKSVPDHDPEAFETFWAAYPRKDNRKKSVEAWDKLKPDRGLCRVMYGALKRQCRDPRWVEEGGKYIPMFSTWLNQRRWENQGVDLSLLQAAPPQSSGGWAPDPEVTR